MKSIVITAILVACTNRTGGEGQQQDPAPSTIPPVSDEYDTYKGYLGQLQSASSRERAEIESAYVMQAIKQLLRARSVLGGNAAELDATIKRLMKIGCGTLDSPVASRHIETTPLEDLYPLDLLPDASLVVCASFYLRNGKRVQGRRPLPGWN